MAHGEGAARQSCERREVQARALAHMSFEAWRGASVRLAWWRACRVRVASMYDEACVTGTKKKPVERAVLPLALAVAGACMDPFANRKKVCRL